MASLEILPEPRSIPQTLEQMESESTRTYNLNVFISDPTYGIFVQESLEFFQKQLSTFNRDSINFQTLSRDIKILYQHTESVDFLVLIGATLLIAFARQNLTDYLFKPICKWRRLPISEAEKVPESAWKFLFYLSTWVTICVYMFTVPKMNILSNPQFVWDDYSIDRPVETGIYWIYAIELGYYFHSLYTTVALDQRRKDTAAMMVHHFLTILLMTISFSNRCHKSGLLVLFLHDSCDIFLEGTKLLKYFKVQNGRVYNSLEPFVNIGFFCFISSWIINRLYWFPLKQVYYASIYVDYLKIKIPFFFALNFMLWVLLVLNIYWFTFALILLFKVLTGQLKEIEDTREFQKTRHTSKSTSKIAGSSKNISSRVMKIISNTTNKSSDETKRKFSCDSGVADNSSDDDLGHITPERTTPIPEESENSSSNNSTPEMLASSGYNLRHRK